MAARQSLKRRVALAFATLGAVLSALLCIAIWFAARDVSQRLMDQTLREELADYMARHARNPASLPPATAHLRGFRTHIAAARESLPPALADIGPGQHEVELEGTPYRAAVAERDGERYVILFDERRQKVREQRFLAYVLAAALVLTCLAAVGGLWLAGRVIAPVSELAHVISHSRADAVPEWPTSLRADAGGDEIEELKRSFESYLARLAAFVERERNFAADASHELRTPLAVIRGAAEVIAARPGLDPELRTRIARIERATEEMSQAVEALLLLAREQGDAEDTRCDATKLAQECVDRYQGQAKTQHVNLELDAQPGVQLPAPAALFTIVLGNLVRNAIAHAGHGTVRINLSADALEVADQGPGIDPREHQRIFDRFYRGDGSEGSGIGLFLVRRICDRQGWQIALHSEPITGTKVRISFTFA